MCNYRTRLTRLIVTYTLKSVRFIAVQNVFLRKSCECQSGFVFLVTTKMSREMIFFFVRKQKTILSEIQHGRPLNRVLLETYFNDSNRIIVYYHSYIIIIIIYDESAGVRTGVAHTASCTILVIHCYLDHTHSSIVLFCVLSIIANFDFFFFTSRNLNDNYTSALNI